MPIYSVRSLDVLGNPVDGYEVNDTRRLGEVYLRPEALERATSDADTNEILQALANRGWLIEDPTVPERLEWEGVDQDLVVLTPEDAWVGELEDEPRMNGPRFIAMVEPMRASLSTSARNRQAEQNRAVMEAKLQPNEHLHTVEGLRPTLELAHQEWRGDNGPDGDDVEFWNTVIEYKKDARKLRKHGPCGSCSPPGILTEMNGDEIEGGETQTCDECGIYASDLEAERALHKIRGYGLSIEFGFYAAEERIGIEVRAGDVGDNGAENTSDRFEFDLAEWHRRPTLGFDPVTSEELVPTKAQVNEILVSLDRFMESR